MSALERFENRLRQLVEGTFARVAGGGVQPVEIARSLARESTNNRLVGVSGTFVPNHFEVTLHPADWRRLQPFGEVIRAELEEYVRRQADEAGAQLAGEVEVELSAGEGVGPGQIRVGSTAVAHPVATTDQSPGTGAHLRILSGPRRGTTYAVPAHGVTIGRDPTCAVCLAEPSASRHHAEIIAQGDGFVVRDLASTNGTLVNNQPISQRSLKPGDIIAIGSTLLELRVVHTV